MPRIASGQRPSIPVPTPPAPLALPLVPWRTNLLRGHGSPTDYHYRKWGCRCDACRRAHSEYQRRYRVANPEKTREYGRRYRAIDPQANRRRYRRWREARGDAQREYARRWRAENRDARRAEKRNYKARKGNAGGAHTAADVAAQQARQRGRCFWCKKRVGCHYHVDHVMPLALGGSNSPENIVIAYPGCNLKKHAKHPMDFAGVMC